MRKNMVHHSTLHIVEKAHYQTEIQRKRCIPRLRLPASQRLCHLRLRIHTNLQKKETFDSRQMTRADTKAPSQNGSATNGSLRYRT